MRKLWLAGMLAVGATAMWAQADPPSRVARLNFLEGSVSFQAAGHDDWTAATPNYPLTLGDHLWADEGSRALDAKCQQVSVEGDATLKALAELYEREGDPARARDSGTGLGLPIARAIAEAHGGSLELVRAAPGALFRLTLPGIATA